MRVNTIMQTGTFGGNIGNAADVEDLKSENKNLK